MREALEKAGFKAEFGEVTMKPLNETGTAGEDVTRIAKLLDALESLGRCAGRGGSSAAMDEGMIPGASFKYLPMATG